MSSPTNRSVYDFVEDYIMMSFSDDQLDGAAADIQNNNVQVKEELVEEEEDEPENIFDIKDESDEEADDIKPHVDMDFDENGNPTPHGVGDVDEADAAHGVGVVEALPMIPYEQLQMELCGIKECSVVLNRIPASFVKGDTITVLREDLNLMECPILCFVCGRRFKLPLHLHRHVGSKHKALCRAHNRDEIQTTGKNCGYCG